MLAKLTEFLNGFFYQIVLAIVFLPLVFISYYSNKKERVAEKRGDSAPSPALCDATCDIVTEAIVDGKPLRLKVDTGAQITIIFENSLPLVPPYIASCNIGGAFGGTSPRCYLSTLPEIKVADVTARDVHVAVIPPHNGSAEEKIDGILGIDFMRNYKAVIDKNELALYEKEGR